MKIAMVAPLYESVPPSGYGGTERVISALTDELVEQGHDVTLFAAAGSDTRAHLVVSAPAPLRTSMSRRELAEVAPHLHLGMLAEVYRQASDFDIIHADTDIWTLPMLHMTDTPTVVTMHGRLDLDVVQRIVPLYPDTQLISISNAQRCPLARSPLRWAGTCYNGLDLSRYFAATPAETPATGDYFAFVGRITPEKRPDWAVEIAARTGVPLRVAAKVDPADEDYYRDVIQPIFEAHDVDFMGEIGESDKPGFYAGARALLFPIDWPEPFGLVMIEALASGTPVIALDRGSVREVVTHRVSGAICRSVDEMVHACGWIDQIAPENCRREARRFTARAMAAQYAAVYAEVIGSSSGTLVSSHARPVPWPSECGAARDVLPQRRESVQ